MKAIPKPMLIKGAVGLALVFVAFCAGFVLRGGSPDAGHAGHNMSTEVPGAETWTCSMHPQINLPGPGKCPICFMDLSPLASDATDDAAPRELTVSENAAALMAIETAPVVRGLV